MTAQSNSEFPTALQRWKDGQWVYFYNHKDNGVQPVDDMGMSQEGKRFTADFVIANKVDKTTVTTALIKAIIDPELNQKIIDNIEVDAKPAIEVVKTYKVDAVTTEKIDSILLATPVKSVDGKIITK